MDWTANHMAIDPEYIEQIRKSEGYAPTAFWDYKQSTSGYGTKAQPGDENIPEDQRRAVFEQRYQEEIAKAAAHVDAINPNLPPGAKAALTSLTYNAGPGWAQSGLGDLVRKGDLEGAATRFLEYNKAGGEVNPGLVARRAREAAWFTSPGQAAPASPTAQPPATPAARMASTIMGVPQAPQVPMPQTAGDVASQLMGQPQAPGGQAGGAPEIQPMQSIPIQFMQRRSPDLSKLRAAFRPQTFSRG